MLPFRKVLFPVDFSSPSQAIVPYVRDAVMHYGTQLTLVHAIAPQPLLYGEYALANLIVAEEDTTAARTALRRFADEMFPGMNLDLHVETGEPGLVIHEAVKRHGADLVMMPTHGLGPLRKLLLGSVASKVLHDVSAAVWTGAHTVLEGHKAGVPYRMVMCAVDQTEEAAVVLRAAAAIAHSYGARMFVYHAVQTPPASGELDVSIYSRELVETAHAWLQHLQAKERIEAPHLASDKPVGEGIRQEALRIQADLIVTGRGHAQGRVSRLWSHLYEVIRAAPCPVLSI